VKPYTNNSTGLYTSVSFFRMSLSEADITARLKRALLISTSPSGNEYKRALETFEAIASTGHAHAQYLLAKELLCGNTKKTEKNENRAKQLLRSSARSGDVGALIALADIDARSPSMKLKVYKYAADAGHPVGLFNLGLMYIDGKVIEQDSRKGLDLCTRAADLGDPDSCVCVARWCLLGDFVERDEKMGVKYLQVALDNATAQGLNEVAYLYMSNCLLHGIGTEKNTAECIKLLESGAKRGHAEVMFRLGLLYSTGAFGATDHIKAKHWFERASANGSGAADYHLGLAYTRARGAMKQLQKAKDCFHQALNRGYRRAANHLIPIYTKGVDGVIRQDKAYAEKLQAGKSDAQKKYIRIMNVGPDITGERSKQLENLIDATGDGDPDAAFHLAKIYNTGKDDGTIMRDEKRAVSLMRRAALDGHADALWEMALYYRKKQKGVQADRCLEEAVRLEHSDAMCSAAYHCIRRQDVARAIILYERAGEIGYGKALFNLGLIYHRGVGGVSKSRKYARKYFSEAGIAGYARASNNMGWLTSKEMPHATSEAWYRRAQDGDVEVSSAATYNLGLFHENREDFESAKAHYEQAAKSNPGEYMRRYANFLIKHPGATEKDNSEGRAWMKKVEAAQKSGIPRYGSNKS